MKKLTRAEEEIMQIIWLLDRCTVSQIIEAMDIKEKPPHSTVSSIARILEKKGFLGYKAYGRTYEYFPLISKEDYSSKSLKKLVSDYFGGSYQRLVSFLVKNEELDVDSLSDLIDQMENHEK